MWNYVKLSFISDRVRSGEVMHIPQAERYSSADWLDNLKSLPKSPILQRIKKVVQINFIWSVIVYILHKIFQFQSPGSRCHSLLGSALGLLLVFRTNSAYQRFWEGRKIWEKILSLSRCMGRMTLLYSDMMDTAKVERILHLLCAFPIVLQEHVQGYRCRSSLLGEYLTNGDRFDLERVNNRPMFILGKLAAEVKGIKDGLGYSSRERLAMLKYVDDLCTQIGACERLVQTPVPLSYVRHTSRFLSLFCLSMPLALVGELGAYIITFVPFVSWSLFGIQEIGMVIEEPFQQALKLEIFANTIRRDLSDLLHVGAISPFSLNIDSVGLGYEVPFCCRVDTLNKKLDEKVLTKEDVDKDSW
jgi:predicted membrane chloride channel (bestrophin family)